MLIGWELKDVEKPFVAQLQPLGWERIKVAQSDSPSPGSRRQA